jgi:hypothetical protein
MKEPTYTVIEIRCDLCGELFCRPQIDDETWKDKHRELHRQGKCAKCHHWRAEHRPTTKTSREYLRSNQRVACIHHMGMGDTCFCAGEDDE